MPKVLSETILYPSTSNIDEALEHIIRNGGTDYVERTGLVSEEIEKLKTALLHYEINPTVGHRNHARTCLQAAVQRHRRRPHGH